MQQKISQIKNLPVFWIKVALKNSHKFNTTGIWNGDGNVQVAKAHWGKYLQLCNIRLCKVSHPTLSSGVTIAQFVLGVYKNCSFELSGKQSSADLITAHLPLMWSLLWGTENINAFPVFSSPWRNQLAVYFHYSSLCVLALISCTRCMMQRVHMVFQFCWSWWYSKLILSGSLYLLGKVVLRVKMICDVCMKSWSESAECEMI